MNLFVLIKNFKTDIYIFIYFILLYFIILYHIIFYISMFYLLSIQQKKLKFIEKIKKNCKLFFYIIFSKNLRFITYFLKLV
jgi:hypothetical protein